MRLKAGTDWFRPEHATHGVLTGRLLGRPPCPRRAIHTTLCRPYISHVQVSLTLNLHEVCMVYRGGVYRTTRTRRTASEPTSLPSWCLACTGLNQASRLPRLAFTYTYCHDWSMQRSDAAAVNCLLSVYYYARQHICYSAYIWQFRLSVRLSHGCISQKRLKLGSFHHTVAPSL